MVAIRLICLVGNEEIRALSCCLFFLVVSTLLFGQAPIADAKPKKLVLERVIFAQSSHEISGLNRYKGKLITVSDNRDNEFVYEILFGKQRFDIKPMISLRQLVGYKDYKKHLQSLDGIKEKHRRFDLEGVAVCGAKIYLVNERVREVLLIDGRSLTRLAFSMPRRARKRLHKGEPNAGLEGVAVDCRSGTLYVAKERSPRRIFIYSLAKRQYLRSFTLKRGGEKEGKKGADFSDLAFHDGYLYILARHARQIVKVDPKSLKTVDTWSYAHATEGLYLTGESFGLAEGLMVEGKTVHIALDHNKNPLTKYSQETYGVKENVGAILRFKLPEGA